jgi:SAM-dependent methyltransferase
MRRTRTPEPSDYRIGWQNAQAAQAYERDLREDGSYGGWSWELEREELLELVDRWFPLGRKPRYLDFACGTGRIIGLLEDRVETAVGVDSSASMLEVAQQKLSRSRLICGDVTTDPSLVTGPYDLITAFRFFMNAGDELRAGVLTALYGVLSDDGILVFNIHSNKWSLRMPSVLIRRHLLGQHWVRQMSYREARQMLEPHGLQIVEVHGCNFLTSKGYRLIPHMMSRRIERLLTAKPLRYLAVDLIFVCRKAPTMTPRL